MDQSWLSANLDGEIIPFGVEESEEYLKNTIELFLNPVDLLTYQDEAEDGEGMTKADMIIGSITMNLDVILFNEDVDRNLRVEVAESIYSLYEGYYQYLEKGSFSNLMFWDSVMNSQTIEGTNSEVKDALLHTLEQILNIPNKQCQLSALHGLSYLNDPKCEEIIDMFLESNEVDGEVRSLAGRAKANRVK